MRTSSNHIEDLKENEVFVFGSNILGNHASGAARLALMKFGAINGRGIGMQGQSYAIPTMFPTTKQMEPFINEFIQFAKEKKDKNFLVTEVGCGIAGFKPIDIAPMFSEAIKLPNVYLPVSFCKILLNNEKQYTSESEQLSHLSAAAMVLIQRNEKTLSKLEDSSKTIDELNALRAEYEKRSDLIDSLLDERGGVI